MPKQLNLWIDEAGKKLIEIAMKTDSRAEVRQQATAIQLLDREQGPSEVAAMLAVSLASVYT